MIRACAYLDGNSGCFLLCIITIIIVEAACSLPFLVCIYGLDTNIDLANSLIVALGGGVAHNTRPPDPCCLASHAAIQMHLALKAVDSMLCCFASKTDIVGINID